MVLIASAFTDATLNPSDSCARSMPEVCSHWTGMVKERKVRCSMSSWSRGWTEFSDWSTRLYTPRLGS